MNILPLAPTTWGAVLLLALAYSLGSIPTGYLVVRFARGQDIRTLGSGNTGGTNVSRTMGRKWGVAVTIFDMLKGAAAIALTSWLCPGAATLPALCGLAAVIGHNYPVWLGWSGGKGVATTFGTLFFAAVPLSCLAVAATGLVWLICLKLWRMVSLASLVALFTAPALMVLLGLGHEPVLLALALAILSAWRHRANLVRIAQGTENKIGQK